jgi:5-methylcytosine-specific restriction protein A
MILVKKYTGKNKGKNSFARNTVANREIYNSVMWRGKDGIRKQRLTIDPFCVYCNAPAEDVDHIKPINDFGDPFDIDNTQSMCKKCHSRKSATERK